MIEMVIKVCEKPCDQCLFSDNKIVSEKRKLDIIHTLEKEDGWFVCHKSSIVGEKIMCNGWYMRYKNRGLLKIACRLGILKLYPVPKIED